MRLDACPGPACRVCESARVRLPHPSAGRNNKPPAIPLPERRPAAGSAQDPCTVRPARSRRTARTCSARLVARAIGKITDPAITSRCIGCRRNSKFVTTPKLPPPPRTPQNRSGFSLALACRSLSVGRDHIHRLEIVDRHAEAAGEAPETSAEWSGRPRRCARPCRAAPRARAPCTRGPPRRAACRRRPRRVARADPRALRETPTGRSAALDRRSTDPNGCGRRTSPRPAGCWRARN